MSEVAIHKNVTYWFKAYANPGITDQRAVETFIDCESAEGVSGLRAELQSIKSGNYREQSLDLIMGAGRRMKHGSYEEWARMMLMWMGNYKPY